MTKSHHTFYEVFDYKGRRCIRLDKRNGRILARWRDDMPGQRRGHYQWVREKNAVLAGYGDICFDAIRAALYSQGFSDFDPFSMCPEVMQYTAVFVPVVDDSQMTFGDVASKF